MNKHPMLGLENTLKSYSDSQGNKPLHDGIIDNSYQLDRINWPNKRVLLGGSNYLLSRSHFLSYFVVALASGLLLVL